MPDHDEALNDRSSMPPVSVTMQPRVLVPDPAAALPEPAGALELAPLPLGDEAELWLLPHAASTTVADTASAAVAHALCFTLTSTGPARYCAWPRIRPGLSRRVCPAVFPWEGDTRLSGLLVAESEPDHEGIPGRADIYPGPGTWSLVPSYKTGSLKADEVLRCRLLGHGVHREGRGAVRRHAGEIQDGGEPAAGCLAQLGRAAVGGDQAVHDGQAETGAVRVRGGEPQEGPLPVLGAHARAVVGHDELRAGRGGGRGHRDAAAGVERLERVRDQVVEHLLQVALADPGRHRGRLRRQ